MTDLDSVPDLDSDGSVQDADSVQEKYILIQCRIDTGIS
jgi:hypothetical protein